MAPRQAWKVLGLAPGSDVGAIRRAYADKLRAMDPDADPAAFDRLRGAREVALAIARHAAESSAPVAPPEEEGERTIPLPAFAAPVLDGGEVAGSLTVAPPNASPAQPLTPDRGGDSDERALEQVAPDPIQPSFALSEVEGHSQVLRLRSARTDIGDHASDLTLNALDAALPVAGLTAAALETLPVAGTIAVPTVDAHAVADAAYDRILTLLLPNGEPSDYALDADEQAEMDAALDMVTADPRLEELGFRDRAETWFAEVLADAIPRSDTIIPRIAALFGWRERAGRIGEAPTVEQVVDRARILHFVDAVQDPGHRFHKEWAELTDSVPERRFAPWRASRSAQRTLLTHIRGKLPGLEAWLDPGRVAKVDNQVSGPGVPFWALGLIAAALLRLCSGLVPDTQPVDGNVSVPVMAEGSSEPLSSRDRDLDVALLDVANGFTAVSVRDKNPALFLALDRLWQDAHARGERVEPFRREVSAYLDGQLRRAIRQAEYDDIAAYRWYDRLTLDKLAELDPGQCATANRADPALTLNDGERQERRALHARMLLAVTPGMTPPDRYTFRVPGEVMAAIGDSTRLPRSAVSQALNNKGAPEAICRVRAALIDAALKLPRKQGLPLLRDL